MILDMKKKHTAIRKTAVVLGAACMITTMTALPVNASAGVTAVIESTQKDNVTALSGVNILLAQTMTLSTNQVQEETEVQAAVAETPASIWDSRLMTNVSDEMNVRDSASEDGNIVGYLRSSDVADIISAENGWYQITSGAVSGYVSAQYVITGAEAEARANELTPTLATVTENGLRIREAAAEDAAIVKTVSAGDVLTVNTAVPTVDGWVAVEEGYISADYVTVSQEYSTAITAADRQAELDAIAAEEAAAKAEEERKAQEAQEAKNQQAAVMASADDLTLMAAIIQLEAGNQPYEGQVAVGSVIMNRLRSGRWGGSISGVIFAPGQFYPAGSAAVANVVAAGPKASCMQAAQDALNGVDMVGGRTQFRPVSSGRDGIVIGGHVFF